MESLASKKSQILKLSLIVALLVVTPFLSTSLRSTYLYFLFNILIITLGAEAGLLSFFSKAALEKKPSAASFLTPKIPLIPSNKDDINNNTATNTKKTDVRFEEGNQKMVMHVVEKCSSAKIVVGAVKVRVLKKCPSTPSLFFIGGSSDHRENEAMAKEESAVPEEYDHEEEALPSGQELYHKAETFIGNFYKQLKMQREDSWKKIHGLYHKAF